MTTKIQIDGVGTVEVDDSFSSQSPEDQQRTVEEIASSAGKHSAAPAAHAPAPAAYPTAPKAPPAQRNPQETYQALGQFVTSRYPNAKITSGKRSPEHNAEVGGAKNSYHLSGDAIDVTGLTEGERNRLYVDLSNAGIKPNEFMYHKVPGGGLHLHLAVDHLPDGFGQPKDAAPTQAGDLAPAPAIDLTDKNAALAKMVHDGATDQQLNDFAAQNNFSINQEQLKAFRDKGGTEADFTQAKPAAPKGPERTWGDTAKNAALSLGEGVASGTGGLVDLAAEGITGPFHSDPNNAWNPGAQEGLTNLYDDAIGKPEASTNGERYLNAAAHLTGEIAAPLGPIGKLGYARKALGILAAGAGGGVTGEAAHDVAPALGVNPDTARTVGQVVGSIGGGLPLAAKPIREANFVSKGAKEAKAPFAAHAVEQIAAKAAENKPNGFWPKSRGPVSVEEINGIGKRFLAEITPRLSQMDLSDVDKSRFSAAIMRKADIKADEIKALEGTPTGDAVAEGIRYFQATRTLTPGYNGYKPGIVRKLAEGGVSLAAAIKTGGLSVLAQPMIRRAFRGGSENLNMSRLDAGKTALRRKDAWKKIGDLTGADQVGKKTDAFIQAHTDLATAKQAEADATAASRADAQEASAASRAERSDNKLFKETFPNRPKSAPEPQPYKPSSTVTKANSALQKMEEKAYVGGTTKAIDKLNAPPKPITEAKPKARPAIDRYVEENIKQGVHGNYNAYADTLGVERSDVLAALRQIKTDDIDPFELQKLTHGYKLSPAGRAALIPRLQKQLKESGVVDFRAKGAAAAEAAPKAAAPKSAKALKADPPAPAAEPVNPEPVVNGEPPKPERGGYRHIARKENYENGTARIKKAQADRRDEMWSDNSGLSSEILKATEPDIKTMIEHHRTAEEAMDYFDNKVVPRFEGMDKAELKRMRPYVERIVQEKRHQTVADFEREAKHNPKPGRPRKPADDYPDPKNDPDYVPF